MANSYSDWSLSKLKTSVAAISPDALQQSSRHYQAGQDAVAATQDDYSSAVKRLVEGWKGKAAGAAFDNARTNYMTMDDTKGTSSSSASATDTYVGKMQAQQEAVNSISEPDTSVAGAFKRGAGGGLGGVVTEYAKAQQEYHANQSQAAKQVVQMDQDGADHSAQMKANSWPNPSSGSVGMPGALPPPPGTDAKAAGPNDFAPYLNGGGSNGGNGAYTPPGSGSHSVGQIPTTHSPGTKGKNPGSGNTTSPTGQSPAPGDSTSPSGIGGAGTPGSSGTAGTSPAGAIPGTGGAGNPGAAAAVLGGAGLVGAGGVGGGGALGAGGRSGSGSGLGEEEGVGRNGRASGGAGAEEEGVGRGGKGLSGGAGAGEEAGLGRGAGGRGASGGGAAGEEGGLGRGLGGRGLSGAAGSGEEPDLGRGLSSRGLAGGSGAGDGSVGSRGGLGAPEDGLGGRTGGTLRGSGSGFPGESVAGEAGHPGGGYPMGGGGGRRKSGDEEAPIPDYLVETDDVWGDGVVAAPAVIGEQGGNG